MAQGYTSKKLAYGGHLVTLRTFGLHEHPVVRKLPLRSLIAPRQHFPDLNESEMVKKIARTFRANFRRYSTVLKAADFIGGVLGSRTAFLRRNCWLVALRCQ